MVQARALQNSQSPVDTEGAVMNQHGTFAIPAAGQFCSHFEKLMTRTAPNGASLPNDLEDALRMPIARLMVGSA